MSVFTDVCEKINKIQEIVTSFSNRSSGRWNPTVIKVPKNPKMFIVRNSFSGLFYLPISPTIWRIDD